MDYGKIDTVDITEQFFEENVVHSEEATKVENDYLCVASQSIDTDSEVDSHEDDSKSNESIDGGFVKRKDRIDRAWLKSFMKNLFESNNIDSEEVHLVDQDISTKEEDELIHYTNNREREINDVKIQEMTGVNDSMSDKCSREHYDEVTYKSKRHKYILSSSEKFECVICGYVSDTKKEVTIHLMIKHHKCNFCLYTTDVYAHLNRHIRTVHSNLKQCRMCGSLHRNVAALKSHIDTVHFNVKKHKCESCNYSADKKFELNKHIKTVHAKMDCFSCSFCDFISIRKYQLRRHVNAVHLNLKRYKCTLCAFTTNGLHSLRTHTRRIHLNMAKFKCDVCDYSSKSKREFEKHVNNGHLSSKPYKCFVLSPPTYERLGASCSDKNGSGILHAV